MGDVENRNTPEVVPAPVINDDVPEEPEANVEPVATENVRKRNKPRKE